MYNNLLLHFSGLTFTARNRNQSATPSPVLARAFGSLNQPPPVQLLEQTKALCDRLVSHSLLPFIFFSQAEANLNIAWDIKFLTSLGSDRWQTPLP